MNNNAEEKKSSSKIWMDIAALATFMLTLVAVIMGVILILSVGGTNTEISNDDIITHRPQKTAINSDEMKRKRLQLYHSTRVTNSCPEDRIHYLEYNGYANNPNYTFKPDLDAAGQPVWYGWTKKDFEILSLAIANEADPGNWRDNLYVGSVMLNRLEHPEYAHNHSIDDIIFDVKNGKQYDFWTAVGEFPNPATEMSKAAAYECLKFGSCLPFNVVFQSYNLQGDGLYEKVGNHRYCFTNL